MLKFLHLRDFAIVKELALELTDGLTVLTGETGAGKSIIIDALGLVLGDRGDSSVIRHDCKRTEIAAEFDIRDNITALCWLRDNELDNDDECLLRRTVSSDGRSRAWINGTPATLQQLRALSESMVDIHGQHEHQHLLKREHQRQLLDDYGNYPATLEAVNSAFDHWQTLQQEWKELSSAGQRDQQLELLRFQVEELERLAIHSDELQQLDEEHKRLANVDRLLDGCHQVITMLDVDDELALTRTLNRSIMILEELRDSDQALGDCIDMMNVAAIQIDEAGSNLRRHIENLNIDPERLREVEQRLGQIHDIARKHRIMASEIPGLHSRLADELSRLERADQRMAVLQQEIAQAAETYRRAAGELSRQRRKAARRLEQQVTETMQPLAMPDSQLHIDMQSDEKFSRHGLDRIVFLVATNPRQAPQPLAKIASGGELSRISLAIQVITATDSSIPTLIFDEVDVGIGGAVAEIVGQKLRFLGQHNQILCVTHLPQVAAQGHTHLRVSKIRDDGDVSTTITRLGDKERQQEIARMLGGVDITRQTLAYAREMISNAERERADQVPA